MFRVIGCFVEAHDLGLVLLAAAVCALSSFTVVALLLHGRRISGPLKTLWLAIAAIAGGAGIWATHFIGMLAFAPGVASAYNLALTMFSLAEAVLLSGLGFSIVMMSRRRSVEMLGGSVVGGGIATMHYTGIAAFEIAGRITWDPAIVGVSIVLGAAIGAVALPVAVESRTWIGRLAGALLLVLAICGHHFTAMGALTITPDPRIVVPESALPASWLAIAVALASFALLLLAGAALGIDVRDRRHASLEGDRLRSLANAAVEGLVVCKGDTIVSANKSFAKLVGLDAADVGGRTVSEFFVRSMDRLALAANPEVAIEAELRCADDTFLPVELIMQPVEYTNEPHYALAIRDLRARRLAEGQIQFLAHHDPLTGLANRASFNKRIDQDIKSVQLAGRRLAVLCLDLDRFKEVNDLFGHAAGDALLESVGRTITDLLSDDQIVARLGGDEFAILMPCGDAVDAGNLAERIIEALRTGNKDQMGPHIATSIGIALYPDDAVERQLLLSHADTALYKAKSEGRGTYRFFEAKMGAQVLEFRLIEHDLRHAIARGEIRLVYQPQHDLGTNELTGFEALIRWHHPKRGHVSPATFIPIAEDCGLILQIGDWVLREACREAARWEKPLSIAVNVSAVQIHAPAFAASVHETLLTTGLAPSRLELEITETALVRDQARALLTLRQLKAMGLRIAMDDFGTGYSSLSNLRAFPFDKIKIDASFIKSVETNEQTAAIVRSILGLGQGLGVPVLAEGVETDAQLKFLMREECHAAQGYFLGRPAPIEQFAHLMVRKEGNGGAPPALSQEDKIVSLNVG